MLACGVLASAAFAQETRSATFLRTGPQPSASFVSAESAAVFIGVREFAEKVPPVDFTVDDAIDLAHAFALGSAALVEPQRIVLALSGDPSKDESKRKLAQLQERGAKICRATHTKILSAVKQQAEEVGPNGILIVAVASHGFTDDDTGEHYILADDSVIDIRETVIRTDRLRQLAARQNVQRSVILLDTCRTNYEFGPGRSIGKAKPPLPDQFRKALAEANGPAILRAALEGRKAFEDNSRQNGVFTAAVLDGLRCPGERDEHGRITVGTLKTFVNRQMVAWLKAHGENVSEAVTLDGLETIPLVQCETPAPSNREVLGGVLVSILEAAQETAPAKVKPSENTFSVYNAADVRLWSRAVDGTIAHAEAADLDGDAEKEVIVGVAGRGEDAGKVLVFDSRGKLRWKADTNAAFNYNNARGRLVVRRFAVGDLSRKGTQQIVALSQDAHGAFPSRLTIIGDDGAVLHSYWHPGHLNNVAIGAAKPGDDPRIVVSGINDEYPWTGRATGSVGAIFVLDPTAVSGEAPPYNGNAGRGMQLWYGIVGPARQPIEDLEICDCDHDGHNEIAFRAGSEWLYVTFTGARKDLHLKQGGPSGAVFRLVRR